MFHKVHCTLLVLSVAAAAALPAAAQDRQMATPNDEMQAVLSKLEELGAKPLGTIAVEEARSQPTPADAVMALMAEKSIEPDPAVAAITARDITLAGAAGELPARVYVPPGDGPFPVIAYYHGGGWVIADIDTYDASARALAAGTNAVVVSSHYRQAPEDKFPEAHDDAVAAYEWIVENVHEYSGDASRIAVAGESAGGNLAINVAIAARDRQLTTPLHMLLVYPVAGNDMTTPSYTENAEAKPLSKAGMEWFVENVFADMSEAADPRINLVDRDDLAGLPPATIILAQIDPLRSEGEELGARLNDAGVATTVRQFDGVAHEFFGMGPVLAEARDAMTLASEALTGAFAAVPATE